MRKLGLLLALVPVVLVAVLVPFLRSAAWPLGVRGEWEWLRLARAPAAIDVVLAALSVLAYAGFAALGLRYLKTRVTVLREGLALAGLLVAAVAVQAVVPSGAPAGYGLPKWAFVLYSPA